MAQGKRYSDEIKEKALALLAVYDNNALKVAKELGLPYSSVANWKYDKKKEEELGKSEQELEQLRQDNKKQFINNAWDIISKAQNLLERRLNRAIECEDEIDRLIDELIEDDDLGEQQRKAILSKLKSLKLEDTRELSTVLGTLYDKQALANKEATSIVEGNIGVKKFEDL